MIENEKSGLKKVDLHDKMAELLKDRGIPADEVNGIIYAYFNTKQGQAIGHLKHRPAKLHSQEFIAKLDEQLYLFAQSKRMQTAV